MCRDQRVNPLIEFISAEECIIFASPIPLKFCMRSERIMYNKRALTDRRYYSNFQYFQYLSFIYFSFSYLFQRKIFKLSKPYFSANNLKLECLLKKMIEIVIINTNYRIRNREDWKERKVFSKSKFHDNELEFSISMCKLF